MSETHKACRWAKQLTDEQITELLKLLFEGKANKKFQKVLKIVREEDCVTALYAVKRLNCYMTYGEENLRIQDFQIGVHSVASYAQFMTEIFGEEYAKEMLAYATEQVAENPTSAAGKRFARVIVSLENLVNQQNQGQTV